MTHVRVDGTLCAAPGDRISAILTGDVGGEPVTLQIIVNNLAVGDSQALVVMAPPLTDPARTPSSYGADPRAMSTFNGYVVIPPRGQSATISADLTHVMSPDVQHVTGHWDC